MTSTATPPLPDNMCPCQYGPCGHCAQRERHDQCITRRVGPITQPAAYLTRKDRALALVWTTGQPCQWVCSCPCSKTGGQLTLFGSER